MRLPTVGERFHGDYELIRTLGRGGFAIVYQARDGAVGRDVAIKVLLPDGAGYKEDVEQRFMREARVLARLQHPNTITMFDFGRSDSGLLFMVFEFIDGAELADVIASSPLSEGAVVHILTQVLGALVEAHTGGLLHRDIKPANILISTYLDDPYQATLIDFGIAKPMVDRTGVPSNLTREGVVVGTPRYMAPEQFFGEELTPSADLYSLGLVAHEMLCGDRAVDAPDSAGIIRRQLAPDPIRVPAQFGSPALRAVVDRMTARDVANRYPSASAVLDALAEVRGLAELDQLETAPRLGLSSRTVAPSRPTDMSPPRRGPQIAVVVIVVLAIAGVLAVASQATDETAPIVLPRQLTEAAPSPPVVVAPVKPVDVGLAEDLTTAADGCRLAPPVGRLARFDVEVGRTRRSWDTYVPKTYRAGERHPVVLLFHRSSRVPHDMMAATQMAKLADEKGFVVLSYHAEDSSNPWTERDDSEFVAQALDAMSFELCLDLRRVYAIGDGGGGRFVRNLPCQMSLSAVATTASGQYPDERVCEASPATPMIRLYGSKDRDVPPSGGPGCLGGREFMSADEISRRWRGRNGCEGRARRWMKHPNGRCDTWACGGAPFVTCAMDGGHDWPGGPRPLFKLPGCAVPPPDFPIGETIWKFFTEHGRLLHVAVDLGLPDRSR